jgi:hypothetical protein
LIVTLLITVLVEGIVACGYSIGRGKPLGPILFTSLVANLITQSFLWVGLNLFFQHYLSTLLIAESLIWMIESIILYCVPANQLRFTEALFLSLTMNLVSFVLGWFLPV